MTRESAATLIDATVQLVGVTAAVRNARGQFLCPSLSIGSPADIDVVQAAPGPAFEAPFIPIDRMATFSGEPLPRHRVRTRGTVLATLTGNVLFLQKQAGGLRVQASAPSDIQPGDIVEVAGFIEMCRQIAGLTEADVRRVGREASPEPTTITPEEIASVNDAARRTQKIATPGDFDGCLVTFRARVVEVKPTAADGGQITLSSGNTTLSALIDREAFHRLAAVRSDSDVRVTGVVQLQLQGDEGPALRDGRSGRATDVASPSLS